MFSGCGVNLAMLIIPELKKVVIMPPRSGSTALKKQLLSTYPQAISLYRHGEDMMRQYAPWDVSSYTTTYILRNPVDRLVSLWRYMQDCSVERNPRAPLSWINRVNADASRPFSHWLHTSTELFNESTAHPMYKSPESYYCTHFQVPAARKSAREFLYGAENIEIVRFGVRDDYWYLLGIEFPERANASTPRYVHVSADDMRFIEHYHHSDMILGALK